MARFQCYPIDDPKSLWLFCPSYGAAIAFAVLFGLITLAHVVQAVWHRKPFLMVLITGSLWEAGGYVARTFSVIDQKNEPPYTVQLLLIILAPLWLNAFCYMCLGRMIHCFTPPKQDKVFGFRARRIGLMFVLADIGAFIIQLTGAMMLSPDYPASVQQAGLHVYMGGVGVQLFFILIFLCIAIKFQLTLRRQSAHPTPTSSSHKLTNSETHYGYHELTTDTPPLTTTTTDDGVPRDRSPLPLLYTLYAALLLIVFRNLYRLIEFSAGVESSITKNEWYTFVFDSTPMLLAWLLFNFWHPGRFLHGPRADFSHEKKEIKAAKKARKAAKKAQSYADTEAMLVARAAKRANGSSWGRWRWGR